MRILFHFTDALIHSTVGCYAAGCIPNAATCNTLVGCAQVGYT